MHQYTVPGSIMPVGSGHHFYRVSIPGSFLPATYWGQATIFIWDRSRGWDTITYEYRLHSSKTQTEITLVLWKNCQNKHEMILSDISANCYRWWTLSVTVTDNTGKMLFMNEIFALQGIFIWQIQLQWLKGSYQLLVFLCGLYILGFLAVRVLRWSQRSVS